MSAVFPKEILPWHTAILGKTGKGKSTTARDLVEQVVPAGSRVCILDTVKSDWWGITSSADGKKAGLPFTILGGPHAHLPLSRNMGKALGELVATGALPLSIIDMADFGPGDASHFFVDFAQALMKKMKGVLYLVIEEAHEIAPKERVGFAKENMGVYWAKKLATAGRTKGIRLVVLSQRVQALHNAVLGSCENMVVHGMTAPADQEPVVKWLKSNVKDKALRQAVEDSLSSLPTGTGWLCSGEAKLFELTEFPRSKTFDNTATPEDDSALQEVKTAKVDVEQLRTLLAGAVKEAESNDVPSLKKRIAELERDIRNAPKPRAVEVQFDRFDKDIIALEVEAHREGWNLFAEKAKAMRRAWVESVEQMTNAMAKDLVERATAMFEGVTYDSSPGLAHLVKLATSKGGLGVASKSAPPPKANGNVLITPKQSREIDQRFVDNLPSVTGVQQRILDALANLENMGSTRPPAELICFMAGYSNMKSKGFANAMSSLRTGGLIQGMALTDAGRAVASPERAPADAEELQEKLMTLLGGAARRVLEPLIKTYPDELAKTELMTHAGYENAKSKGFANMLSRLRTLGFIDYTPGGGVVAMPVLFLQ